MFLTRGVLLAGQFRTQRDLNKMSHDDMRNTLIVELAGRSRQTKQRAEDQHAHLRRDVGVLTDRGTQSIGGAARVMAGLAVRHHAPLVLVHEHDGVLVRDDVRAVDRVDDGGQLQAFDDDTLAGMGALLVYLRTARIRNDAELKTMMADDMRNTLIVELGGQTGLSGSTLQSMSNIELVLLGLGRPQPGGSTKGHFIRGVLLAGQFRTQHELNLMSADDQRNTLIVEMAKHSNQNDYQAFNDFALGGAGAVMVFLRTARIRTDAELKTMSADDQRNTLIVEIGAQTNLGSRLQGLTNIDLVLTALGVDSLRSMTEATAAILRHYPRVGGPTGLVGVPMGDVRPIPGGFMRPHSAGDIHFLDADIGPQGFHTKEASVRFVGFRCHQQSENGPDEPYFIIGIQGFNDRDLMVRTFGPFEGSEEVETGDNRVLEELLITTASPPFSIHVRAMENDSGSPAEASAALEKGMKDGAAKLTVALAVIDPVTVFAVGGAVQSFLAILGGPIADGLSAVFGMGDDFIGQNSMTFFDYDESKNEWRTPAPKNAPDFPAPHNVELVLDNGEGGRYSVYFQVTMFTIDRVPVAAEK